MLLRLVPILMRNYTKRQSQRGDHAAETERAHGRSRERKVQGVHDEYNAAASIRRHARARGAPCTDARTRSKSSLDEGGYEIGGHVDKNSQVRRLTIAQKQNRERACGALTRDTSKYRGRIRCKPGGDNDDQVSSDETGARESGD